jgi:hypothetical protein
LQNLIPVKELWRGLQRLYSFFRSGTRLLAL